MGGLDHRTLGRMELLLQAAGADHLPARQGAVPFGPSRQTARNGAAMRSENLEASVRSRDTDLALCTMRDLIEAGLN